MSMEKSLFIPTKTAMYVGNSNDNGEFDIVMPGIKDVNVIFDDDSIARAVVMTFSDGTTERAKVCNGDAFNFEYGISICITKKLISMRLNKNMATHSTSVYNKLVKYATKVYHNGIREKRKKEEEEKRIKDRIQKCRAKKKARDERRANEMKEYMIEIQKEAYKRAIMELNTAKKDEN